MDGFSATQRIREIEAEKGGAHVCIIALTAMAMPGDHDRCLNAGMDDYMVSRKRPEGGSISDCRLPFLPSLVLLSLWAIQER
jgi:CheY-like chemotaxis protein